MENIWNQFTLAIICSNQFCVYFTNRALELCVRVFCLYILSIHYVSTIKVSIF